MLFQRLFNLQEPNRTFSTLHSVGKIDDIIFHVGVVFCPNPVGVFLGSGFLTKIIDTMTVLFSQTHLPLYRLLNSSQEVEDYHFDDEE